MNAAQEHYKNGNRLRSEGHDIEALNEYQKALQCNPDFLLAKKSAEFLRNHLEKIFISFGKLYAQEGYVKDACKEFKQALKMNPQSWRTHQRLSERYRSLQKIETARRYINHAIALAPSHANLYLTLGAIEDANETYSAAYTAYQKASERAPHNTEIRKQVRLSKKLCELHAQKHDKNNAIYTELDVAAIYIEKGMPDTATTRLCRIINQFPDHQGIRFTLANLYYGKEEYHQAEKHFRICLTLKSEAVSLCEIEYRLGLTLVALGNKSAARNSFTNSITLSPQSRPALRAKAELEKIKNKQVHY